MSRPAWIACLLLLAALVTLRILHVQPDEVQVRVDTSVRHQTIEGFGARVFAPERVGKRWIETLVPPADQLEEVLLRAARELRLNHLAVEIPRRFEPIDDDADPFTFQATADDERVVRRLAEDHLATFQNAVANEGRSSFFEVHEWRDDRQPAWRANCPPEAEEHVRGFLALLRDRFPTPPERWVVHELQAPDGPSASPLPDLGGIPVTRVPLEVEPSAPTVDELLDALAGGATRWNEPKLYQAGTYPDVGAFLTAPTAGGFVVEGPSYWELRQVTFHVPAGAVRVGCSSDDAAVRTLAFDHGGRTIVVLTNLQRPRRAKKVHLHGLEPGPYTVSVVSNGRPPEERGIQEVPASGEFTLEMGGRDVVAIARHPGPNQRPTITQCEARPAIPLWDERIELLGLAADPENAALRHHWEVLQHPEAATLSFHSPDARATRVTGLKPVGRYVFRFTVTDDQGLRDERELVVERPPGVAVSFPHSQRRTPVPAHASEFLDASVIASLHPWPPRAGLFAWSLVEGPTDGHVDLAGTREWLCEVSPFDRAIPGRYRVRCETFLPRADDERGFTLSPSLEVDHTLFVWPASPDGPRRKPADPHEDPLILEGNARPAEGEAGTWELIVHSNLRDDLPKVFYWTLEERPEGSGARVDWRAGQPQRLVGAVDPGLYRLRLSALGEWPLGSTTVELRVPGEDGR